MKLFGIDTDNVRQDYVVHYCVWLSELKIPQICDLIRDKILATVRDERYAFHDFFSEQNIDAWRAANNPPKDNFALTTFRKQSDITLLENIPSDANTIYDVLETLRAVGQTFQDIEAIDVSEKASSLTIASNAIMMLLRDFPIVYGRLQNLNHSSVGISLMITPLLEPLFTLINNTKNLKDRTLVLKDRVIEQNKDAIAAFVPKHVGGLAFISHTTILSSFLLKELTELIERGDTTIDFDPTSPEILKLESRFNKEFKQIKHAKALLGGLGPMGRLAKLLYDEMKKILNKSVPLTEAGYAQSKAAFKTLECDILSAYRIEVERFEENIGLASGTLVQPFEEQKARFLHTLSTHLDKLGLLPDKTRALAQSSEQPVSAIAGSLWGAVQRGVMQLVPFVNASTPAVAPVVEIVPFTSSETYHKKTQSARLKRLAHLHSTMQNEDLETTAHQFFMQIKQYSQQFGPKKLRELPETVRLSLKQAYITIQPYFARNYPKLDIDIVAGFNQTGMTTHLKQADSLLDQTVIQYVHDRSNQAAGWYLMALIGLQRLPFEWANTFANRAFYLFVFGVSVIAVAKNIANYRDNELTQIAACEESVLIDIRQAKSAARFKHQLIENRFETELALTGRALTSHLSSLPDYQQALQKQHTEQDTLRTDAIAHLNDPMTALGSKFHYKTLFGKLKELQWSDSITKFEEKTLYPTLQKLLNDRTNMRLFGLSDDLCALKPNLPFTEFYQDTDNVVLYKTLCNAFYHLKTCLIALETVDDYGEPSAWNMYGRGVVAVKTLLPILTDGITAYFDLVDIAKSPLVGHIVQLGLSELKGIETMLPMIGGVTKVIQQATNRTPLPLLNSKQAWLTEQAQYKSMVNKTRVETLDEIGSDNEDGSDDDSELSEQDIDEKEVAEDTSKNNIKTPLTVASFATWIASQAHQFKAAHHQLIMRAHDREMDEEALQAQATQSMTAFFDQLAQKAQYHLYDNNPAQQAQSAQLIQQLKDLSLESDTDNPTPSNAMTTSTWTLFADVKNTLQLLDKISTIIHETYHEHAGDVVDQINYLHVIFGYKLLTMVDDIEVQFEIKPGLFSASVSHYLDAFFEKLIGQFAVDKQSILAFWVDQSLLNLRALQKHEQLAHHRLFESIDSALRIVDRVFVKLTKLRNEFPTDKSIDFRHMPSFELFNQYYEILQPYLNQYNKKYDQTSFLKSLHNHRPDLVIAALDEMIASKPQMIALTKSLHESPKVTKKSLENLIENMERNEQKKQALNTLSKGIEHILNEAYAPYLGNYGELFVDITKNFMIRKFTLNPAVIDLLTMSMHPEEPDSREAAAHTLQETLSPYVEQCVNSPGSNMGQLFNTLFEINQFEAQVKQQRQSAMMKAFQEKSDYTLCLKPTSPPFFAVEGTLYFDYIAPELYYTVVDPQGDVIRQAMDPAFLHEISVDLSHGLDIDVIEKQLTPKLNTILNMTNSKGHTEVKNPCLSEKMNYLRTIGGEKGHSSRIQEQLEAAPIEPEAAFYKELHAKEVIRPKVLWNYRQKKLKKYDKIIEAYQSLNALESEFKEHRNEKNKHKIALIKSLKSILKDKDKSPQNRLNTLALKLSDNANRTLLSDETSYSGSNLIDWVISPFIKWKQKEKALLNNLYNQQASSVKIILTLNEMETYLMQQQTEITALSWDKIVEIRALKALLQQVNKPQSYNLDAFVERLTSTNSVPILAKHSDGQLSHFVKQLFSWLTGWKRKEDQLLEELCQPKHDFLEITLILNQMQRYVEEEALFLNMQKKQKITHLKDIMQGHGSQEARLTHLAKELAKDEYKTILSSNSDTYLGQLLKQLVFKLTGWIRKEDHLLTQLNHKLSFFTPKQSPADLVMHVQTQPTVDHARDTAGDNVQMP